METSQKHNYIGEGTSFYREDGSFCIENSKYNDAVFYINLELEENTAYKVTATVKTEDIKALYDDEEIDLNDAKKYDVGASIGILDTTEVSNIAVGNNDSVKLELTFNSRNRESVNICFRLGGYNGEAMGKACFSDIKFEKTEISDNTWNMVCFNIENIDATLNGKSYKISMTSNDKSILKEDLERFKTTMESFSNDQMKINIEIIDISEPLTSLSYSNDNGYYIEPNDVYELINDYVEENEYDHIFIATRMGDVNQNIEIPVNEWIGLGGMRYKDIGFSDIRLPNDMTRTTMYKYNTSYNTFPEEVFVHEFLHTLERNLEEYGENFAALHDYGKYGYKETGTDGLKVWYKDYVRGIIKTEDDGYTGLSSIVFKTMPLHSSDFTESKNIEITLQASNILFGIVDIFKSIFTMNDGESNLQTNETQIEVSQ